MILKMALLMHFARRVIFLQTFGGSTVGFVSCGLFWSRMRLGGLANKN